MTMNTAYQGPRPEQYHLAQNAAHMVINPTKNSVMHLFKATQTVYGCMVEAKRSPVTFDLQELNRVLDAMETRGHLLACEHRDFHKAYTQLAEFTRTFVQAEILQKLPNPPYWAPKYPDPDRLEKHLYKLMEYAILMVDKTDQSDLDTPVPYLIH